MALYLNERALRFCNYPDHDCSILPGIVRYLISPPASELVRSIFLSLIKLLEEHNSELAVANKKLRQEIVERTRVEEALRKSEMKYRNIYFNYVKKPYTLEKIGMDVKNELGK
jgi:hypothetical protein